MSIAECGARQELSQLCGVTVAAIKYYLREGLLTGGVQTAATKPCTANSTYGDCA
ncbi:hypothetical protein O4214_25720 [Rhodococcus erythropolis]|uniref:hypothetical protein n=1 Tax=Rhodococcus erythropolis TaxID=1833 RepID=UPI001E48C0B3|nr:MULTISPECIES: hypothetical protein [Rhodococcus erythropolis group]MCD2109404.1 hypothetical protein [Rhodococcus qingshengii]MCZ4527394.1 hypothetical protein [Rhodococcus erythropolis]